MTCQRCNSMAGEKAVFTVRSDIIDLKVCCQCAEEARNLGLHVELLPKGMAVPTASKAGRAAA
jgi:hypothetical protein